MSNIDLKYLTTIFETLKNADITSNIFIGFKAFAVLFFIINIIRKYQEGVTDKEGYTFGLKPKDLIENLVFLGLIIFSTQLLSFLDTILVAIEQTAMDTAPPSMPVGDPINSEITKSLTEKLKLLMTNILDFINVFGYVASLIRQIVWWIDIFIYPFFLAERFFLLGILQLFFPIIITIAMIQEFRPLVTRFFKLYIAVYLLVPAFLFVNTFINLVYKKFNSDFATNLFGESIFNAFQFNTIEPAIMIFIVFLKFKLYKKSSSFLFQIFT